MIMDINGGDAAERTGRVSGAIGIACMVYLALGALGLLLAVPPGYASPIFPAAGFAVAAVLWSSHRVWPGIWIASFALNSGVTWLGGNAALPDILAAAGIATGATLQALAAARLVRRSIGDGWRELEHGREIVRSLWWSGPVACLISATVGVTTLHMARLIADGQYVHLWWNWWVGDTLGVVVLMPLCLGLIHCNQAPWRRRLVMVAIPMLTALTFVAGTYLAVAKWELSQQRARLDDYGGAVAEALQRRFVAHQEALSALRRLVEVTPDMSYRQFEHFTATTLKDNPDIFALSHNPYVTAAQRDGFEKIMGLRSGIARYEITERNPDSKLVRAGNRSDYVAVGYIAPLEGNRRAVGYDIHSDPVRHDAILKAMQLKTPTVTAPIRLVQESKPRVGVLVLHPAYSRSLSPGGTELAETLDGFAVGVIKVDEMIEIATRRIAIDGLLFQIDDAIGKLPIYRSQEAAIPKKADYQWQTQLPIADRLWEIRVFPTADYIARHRSWLSWGVGAAGLSLVALLQLLLLIATGQSAVIARKVREQTLDLEESRRIAEKAGSLLRESVASVAQGFTIYDENDRLVLCNDTYKEFYAESRDLIVPGNTFEEIVRRGAERGQYQEAMGNIDAWVKHRVTQHQKANGQIIEQRLGDGRWLLIVEYRTPSGYIVGNRIDITSLKQTQLALANSEQRWALAVKGTNDGIWDWSVQSGQFYFSERWKSMLGYAETDLVGHVDEWKSRLHPDDADRVMAEIERHLDGQTDFFQVEFRLRCKDGHYKWVLDRGKALFDPTGTPLRMAGSNTDITDRRDAEARILDRTEQLNAIFELSPDGFIAFDADRRVKYATPAFLRLTGLEEADVINLDERAFSSRLASRCVEQARFAGVEALRQSSKVGAGATAGGDPGDRRERFEIAGPGKRVLEAGLRESQAETVSQILWFRDITHETEVDRLKSEFLSTAAHELRTPMASVYGFTELLLSRTFSPEEQREFLGTIYQQATLMVSIINELLDLARIEARRGKDFRIESLNANVLLTEIAAGFKPPDGRCAPVLKMGNEAQWLRGDRGKLRQLFGNILSNAYKYSPAGGDVEIELLASEEEEAPARVGIRIADHGIGMHPDQLARVFERFYRADTSGKIPGTGLGMSIVKEIVDLHHGRIDIASTAGSGTTVTLWMPAAHKAET